MALALQPTDDERRVATAITVAQTEAVVALQSFCAAPADQRYLQFVRERTDDDRVVGAVRAGDADAALVDQEAKSIGRVLGRALGQPALGVQHELDRSVEQTARGRLVERKAMDLVVATARAVERGAEPPDLDRFHELSLRAGGEARILHTPATRLQGLPRTEQPPSYGKGSSGARARRT